MKDVIKEIISKADEKQRLGYLLGKDDIDDIQAAAVIVRDNLVKELPDLFVRMHLNRIRIESETAEHNTIITLQLKEEHLIFQYNEFGTLELFNPKSECDLKLINKIKTVLMNLGFYKTGETRTQSGKYQWHSEIYKIDVIRRKL